MRKEMIKVCFLKCDDEFSRGILEMFWPQYPRTYKFKLLSD